MTIVKKGDSDVLSRLLSRHARLYIPPAEERKMQSDGVDLSYYYFGNFTKRYLIGENVPEPNFSIDRSEELPYVKLEDLVTGDVLRVDCEHSLAKYLIEITNKDHPNRKLRIWNMGRGPFCFESNVELIAYYDVKENQAEAGALKTHCSTDWPYFVVDSGLRAPQQEWVDTPERILLQRKT